MKNFLLALTFLTIIPAGAPSLSRPHELAAGAVYFPAVGALLGLAFAGIYAAARSLLETGPLVVLIFTVSFIITRGLHIDGLADTADGLVGGGTDREKTLAIMRDSVVGPAGACSILLVYLLKYASLLAVKIDVLPMAILAMPFCGRWNMVLAGAVFKPARAEGLGNNFIGGLGLQHLIAASFIGAAVMWLICHYNSILYFPFTTGIALAFLATLVFSFFISRRLGGLTGDVLGAVNEIAEAVFLLGIICW